MSVIIKGMEMPMICKQCRLYLQSMDSERNVYEHCAVTAKSYNWGLTTRPSDCPLIPAADVVEQRWIPITESLPEIGQHVIAYSKVSGAVESVYYLSYKGSHIWTEPVEEYYNYEEVTHWMPLPEPPKEGET